MGSAGRLGTMLMRDYQKKHEVVGFNRTELDLANCDAIRQNLVQLILTC